MIYSGIIRSVCCPRADDFTWTDDVRFVIHYLSKSHTHLLTQIVL